MLHSIVKFSTTDKLKIVPAISQSQKIVRYVAIFAGFSCAIHLLLGTNPIVAFTAYLIFLLSISPVAVLGFLNIGAVLIALVGFRYVGFPIFAKLAFGQALDTYLFDPSGSFGVTLVGILGYLLALRVSSYIPTGRPFLYQTKGYNYLGRVSLLAAIIGITANIMVALRIDEEYTGVTIANFFVSFLHLALISAIARVIIKTKGRQSVNLWIAILFAIEIEFAMIFNSRMAVMESILCWVVTCISFEAKLRWRYIIISTLVIVLMVTFITPVFLYLRDFRSGLSWDQRTSSTIKIASQWHDAIDNYMDWRDLAARIGWYRNYYGKPQSVFERMSHINNVDIFKNGTDKNGCVGLKDLSLSFKRTLPRVLAPDKPLGYSQGAWLFYSIGIPNPGSHPNAPLIATGYVAFGLIGSFLYPFIFGIAWFCTLKKLSGFNLQCNIWAIYLLLRCHNQFVEGSSDAYLENLLRIFPQDFILLWMVCVLSAGRFINPWRRKVNREYVDQLPNTHL